MRAVTWALRDIRAQWVRYLLSGITMLVGVLGVAAVSVTDSVAADMLVAQQEQLNGREATYINSIEVNEGDPGEISQLYRALTARIGPRDVSVVLSTTTTMQVETAIDRANNAPGQSLMIIWAMGNLDGVQRLPTIAGRPLTQSTFPPELALNQPAASRLGQGLDSRFALADDLRPAGAQFATGAVVADGQSESRAYGNLDDLIAFFPEALGSIPLQVRVSGPTLDLQTATALLRDTTKRLDMPLGEDTHRVDTVQSVRDQVAFLANVFAACAILVLIIATIGIANVGVASVVERAREFVVRRAIGARRRDIFAQVMFASLGVGVVTAIVATGLEVVAVYAVLPHFIPPSSSIEAPPFPVWACLLGLLAALATSALGAALPAIRATRLEVALALRE